MMICSKIIENVNEKLKQNQNLKNHKLIYSSTNYLVLFVYLFKYCKVIWKCEIWFLIKTFSNYSNF